MATLLQFRNAVVAAVTAALPAAVRSPANNDGPTVSWFDGRRPFGKHRLLLSVVSSVPEQDRDTALYQGGAQTISSSNVITVQVQAESSFDTGDVDALWLIEQVRLGLRKVSVRRTLADAEVSIASFPGGTNSRPYPADGRIVSAHSFDCSFRTVFDFDTTGEDAGLIERMIGEGTGELDGADVDVSDPTPEP